MQIPFHKTYTDEEEITGVVAAIKSGWLTMGPKTIEFEDRFRDYLGCRYAVSMNSATAALHLALKAIGLQAGDEVIIPTNTFIATAEVVTYFGAVPVLCDVEEDTHNMDVSKIKKLITSKTRSLIPVHFGGQPCDMDEIMAIARQHKLLVIEDAAHCLPAHYKGHKIGTIGDITCFSFYATKTLCTGEGGMAVTDNAAYSQSMKINRLHGISRDAWDRYSEKGTWYYEVVDNGHKYNTTDINAALGLAQLRKLEWMWQRRGEIAAKYTKAFNGTAVISSVIRSDRDSAWHLYVIKVNNRDDLIDRLKADKIGTSVHFIPVHKHPYYKQTYGYQDKNYPVANDVFSRTLSLPIYPGMTDEQVDYVIEKVIKHAR